MAMTMTTSMITVILKNYKKLEDISQFIDELEKRLEE